ncbi:MAG TPA: crotonase/enoyl-CoA hydratase family protein [Acidimicrobiales bacterium]|nr:crotonase/enoyl-CoA hydratase family protein [Acidimicrobiales bacterium]
MSEQRVTVSIEDHVADVRFNRPDKINALDGEQFAAIVDAGEELKANPDVRAVVLSGNGRGFCAGLDFSSFQAMAGGGGEARQEASPRPQRGIMDLEGRITHLGQQACYVWQEMPCPVIAAVHGVALGGGAQIALGADMRIVAPDAQISILEIRWGLIPDMTGTAMLPLLVGLDRAKELTFTGRMVSGTEAAQIGLATRVSESPLDDALALAREIASKSPTAVRGAKRLLNASPYRGVAEQFADERATIGSLIGSPNQVEAVMAYFEKRDPNFVD